MCCSSKSTYVTLGYYPFAHIEQEVNQQKNPVKYLTILEHLMLTACVHQYCTSVFNSCYFIQCMAVGYHFTRVHPLFTYCLYVLGDFCPHTVHIFISLKHLKKCSTPSLLPHHDTPMLFALCYLIIS